MSSIPMQGVVEGRGWITSEIAANAPNRKYQESSRGRLLIASCSSGAYLANRIAARYVEQQAQAGAADDLLCLESVDRRFSDNETCVRLDRSVAGSDVFLIQALFDPTAGRNVDQNYMAFLIAARTLREHGANYVVAVLPYLAYARQDKPSKFQREPTTARLMADLAREAGIDRLVVWQPHCGQIRGFYGCMPVDVLDALTLFIEEFRKFVGREDVIVVAPDAGASKLATYLGRALNLRCAIASKFRPRPEEAVVTEIIGDFAGKRVAIVVDDMISGGGTVHALVKKLAQERDIAEVHLAVSHNLCMATALERLVDLHTHYHLKRVNLGRPHPRATPGWPNDIRLAAADSAGRWLSGRHPAPPGRRSWTQCRVTN
jgi:ribose-phosphate pyrophosphokinase